MTDSRRFHPAPWPILLLGFIFAFGAAMTLWGPVNLLAWRGGTFPETDPERPHYQRDIMDVTRVQYEQQPSPDRFFSPGDSGLAPDHSRIGPADGSEDPDFIPDASGPWDAAFVSWVLNEVGLPVREPRADDPSAWLVRDTLELADAFAARGTYIPAEAEPDYVPQIGDVIFYDYPWPFGEHVNIVVGVIGREVRTVGGDELGKVGYARMGLRNRGGILGYGATGRLEDPFPPVDGFTFPGPGGVTLGGGHVDDGDGGAGTDGDGAEDTVGDDPDDAEGRDVDGEAHDDRPADQRRPEDDGGN